MGYRHNADEGRPSGGRDAGQARTIFQAPEQRFFRENVVFILAQKSSCKHDIDHIVFLHTNLSSAWPRLLAHLGHDLTDTALLKVEFQQELFAGFQLALEADQHDVQASRF